MMALSVASLRVSNNSVQFNADDGGKLLDFSANALVTYTHSDLTTLPAGDLFEKKNEDYLRTFLELCVSAKLCKGPSKGIDPYYIILLSC